MIIDCIADLHGYKPQLEGGDVLIVAGDFTSQDTEREWNTKFIPWIKEQPYKYKLLVPGNHDMRLEKHPNIASSFTQGMILIDKGVTIEGVNFYGSPWTNVFKDVNPKCTAFMVGEETLERKWDLFPENIDVLITHSPPKGVLDQNNYQTPCGSSSLFKKLTKIRPKYHIYGHIHEQGGRNMMIGDETMCINCSYVDENYYPRHDAYRIHFTK